LEFEASFDLDQVDGYWKMVVGTGWWKPFFFIDRFRRGKLFFEYDKPVVAVSGAARSKQGLRG